MNKKHAKKKDLDYLKDFTQDRLVSRGIIASPENSVIEHIKATNGAPMLPGLKEYLPTPMLINLGRRAFLEFARAWQIEPKALYDEDKLDEFYKFVVKQLNAENYAIIKIMNERAAEINEMVAKGVNTEIKTVGQWLKPQDVSDLTKAVSVFVVDSFAVAVASRSAATTDEFLQWFLRWSQQLLNYWPADLRSMGANIFNNNGGTQKSVS